MAERALGEISDEEEIWLTIRSVLTVTRVAVLLGTYVGKNFIRHLTNFQRSVLSCMDSYDSETRLFFQHFSRSSR